VRFELKYLGSAAVERSKGARKRTVRREQDKVIEIELVQDKTALRSRKGDTGSVLWMARYVLMFQQCAIKTQ
jgi:hypothetical protein